MKRSVYRLRRKRRKRPSAEHRYNGSLRHSVRNRSAYRQKFSARRNFLRKKHENFRRHCGNLK